MLFAAIGFSNVNTVADKYRHVAYHNKTGHWLLSFINGDDLERP